MAPRTSQLQIRVSPEQKATLKRLAARAGLSVSAYVLGQSLPSANWALEGPLADVRDGKPTALPVLRRQVAAMPPEDLGKRLESVDVSNLRPLAQNQVAALVEEVAYAADVEPPRWTASIHPLELPHFRWPLQSLRPYQLRASSVALKRRNVFDPSGASEESPRAGTVARPSVPQVLNSLVTILQRLELEIEFYFIGHAILHQTFPAHPSSARPGAMFADDAPLLDALRSLAKNDSWTGPWPEAALRASIRPPAPGQGYLDIPRLKAFTPPLGYALAMKAGAGALERPGRAEDMRFLLRSLNVTTPDAAMTVITRYIAERHLPADTRVFLGRLLA